MPAGGGTLSGDLILDGVDLEFGTSSEIVVDRLTEGVLQIDGQVGASNSYPGIALLDTNGTNRLYIQHKGGTAFSFNASGAPEAFPWDARISISGIAPMNSSDVLTLYDQAGSAAITVETDGDATFAANPNFTQTTAADSTSPTHINLPTGGTAAQAGWLAVEVNGSTAWVPYWQ